MSSVETIGLANPLRRWRVRNKITQAQLAASVGVHSTVVSQWEQRRAVPTLLKFHRLQRYTGIAAPVLLRFFVPLPVKLMESGVVVAFPARR